MLYLFVGKDTTFPRNFQGFREKILEKGVEKKKIGDSQFREPPIFFFFSPFSSIFSLKPWKLRGKVVSLQKNSNIASTTL